MDIVALPADCIIFMRFKQHIRFMIVLKTWKVVYRKQHPRIDIFERIENIFNI